MGRLKNKQGNKRQRTNAYTIVAGYFQRDCKRHIFFIYRLTRSCRWRTSWRPTWCWAASSWWCWSSAGSASCSSWTSSSFTTVWRWPSRSAGDDAAFSAPVRYARPRSIAKNHKWCVSICLQCWKAAAPPSGNRSRSGSNRIENGTRCTPSDAKVHSWSKLGSNCFAEVLIGLRCTLFLRKTTPQKPFV